MSTIVTRAGKGSPLTNTEVDSNFTNLNTDKVETLASADGSIIITGTGASRDLSVSQNSNASVLLEQVRNSTGATLTRGTAVYISGATGQIPTVSKALATGDATSAQTLGLITSNLANNANGYVTIIGLVSDIDTSAYTDGAQLYLSPTTAGTLTATKPYAPQHLVYVAIVAHAHPTQGKLIVKVQNGYEMDELHNVFAQSPTNGQTLVYNTTTSLWEKNTVSLTAGVNGTLPVANGGTGETTRQNAMDALAGAVTSGSYLRGNGTDVVMSAIQAADVPTLNQNTTGTAANVTGTVAIANGGTGSTTATAALTALGAYPALNPSGYTSNTGTVTGVTGTAPVVSSGGTAPAISMAAASAGVDGYMTGVYATKLDGIAAGATANTGTVTGVTGTAPVVSSGGTAPAISMAAASSGVNGYMTGTYATKLDGIATGATANTGTVTSVSGTGTVSGLTLSGTVTGAGSLTLGGAIGTLNQNTTGTAGGLTGTPNITVGTISTTGITASGDISTYRSGSPTTGVLYLGNNSGTRYLYYDGANYNLNGANLYVNNVQAVTNSGTWGISITGNAATATTAANYLPLAGGTLTGNLGFSGAALFLNRNASATSGISFYSSSYTSWSMYMAAAGATSVGPTANITAPSSTYVTSWALRSFIENAAGYGWTWESGTGSGQPTVVAEIRASDGLARFGGGVVTTTGAFTGNVTVTGTGAVTLKTSGDITAYRSGGTTGVIFLNSAETRYVYWDGSNYQMPGANLQTNGYTVLNTNNYTSYALPLSGGTVSGNITFSGAVGLRITNADIRSDATSNWTGDPGTQGKIQYHANRWYIVGDSSSALIVQFRRNGTDLSYIDNSGTFIGTATGLSNFVNQSGVRYTTDVNSLLQTGFYNTEGQPTNSPVNYGQIIVAKGIDTGLQIAGGYSNDNLYFRGWGSSGGTFFNGWRTVLHNGNYTSYAMPSGSSATNSVDVRAPIFYDSNDTAYYVNPNSQTFIYYTSVNVGNEAPGGANGSSLGLVLRGNYNSNTWAHKIHKYDNGSGVPVYMSYTSGGGAWTAAQGWGPGLSYTSQVFGSFAADSAVYSPIFYDSNNTAYYVDPSAVGPSAALASSIYLGDQSADGVLWDYANGNGYRPGIAVRGNYPHIDLVGTALNGAHGPTLRFMAYDSGASGTYKHWVIGTAANGQTFLDIGFASNASNPHQGISGYSGTTIIRATTSGNVGIGGNWGAHGSGIGSPSYPLHVIGTGYATGDFRAPIFYDSNDTAYYTDPASTSRLNRVDFTNLYLASNNAYGFLGSSLYVDTVNSGDAADQLELCYVRGTFTSTSGSMRAPLFYDRDDTAYYVDPNSVSITNRIRGNSFEYLNDVSVDNTFGLYFGNNLSTAYAIHRQSGAWSHPYPDLRIAFHTGIQIGANATYQGVRFYTDYDMSSQVMSVNNGSDGLGGGNVYVNNSLQAGSSLRAPIFYDSNNTGYYGDFASTSRMNAINADSLYSYGNVTAYSDERLKKDWETLPTNFVEQLAKVKSGTYTRIDSGERQVGVGAQSLQAILKEAVSEKEEYLGVHYGNAALASAVELAKEVVDLRNRVAQLESLISKLIGD